MQASAEISIDLDATELLSPPAPDGTIEVEDFGAIDAPPEAAAQGTQEPVKSEAASAPPQDALEIELTPEQIDELLSGFDPFR
ncbi:MAG TPA: hypothetical protein VF193_02275 [Steroidobacter sp.]